MLHGDQRGHFDLASMTPAECAERLRAGRADVGIVPVVEAARQKLTMLPGVGIACHEEVRSILLVARVPFPEVRTLAADEGSRTSVELARIILERRYGARPTIRPHAPDLDAMLQVADAALLIGDAALRVDLERTPQRVADLGAEWWQMTGLPMVFAVWAARPDAVRPGLEEAFAASYRYGWAHLEDIVRQEAAQRAMPEDMVRRYLTRDVVYELGEKEREGMRLFLELAGC